MEDVHKNTIINNRTMNEIDLVETAAMLWTNKRFILKITFIFVVIGFLIAILTPNKYTASTTLVPQIGEKTVGGGLGGLAAIAGINLGSINNGEVLSPTVYPRILNNIKFQKELIYSKFNFENSKIQISYYEYLTDKKYNTFNFIDFVKKYTLGLPNIIINSIKNKSLVDGTKSSISNKIDRLSLKEKNAIMYVYGYLDLNLDAKEGTMSISYTSEEATLTAEIVLKVQELLQKYITEFKIEKVKKNLEFVEKSYYEAKNNFESKQKELAIYRDANNNISSAIARTYEEKLASEYNLLFNVYNEIAKQKEQAKIALTETTPIFTIIEPVVIPIEKSGPKRLVIITIFMFLGLVIGISWKITYPIIYEILENIKKINNK